MATDHPIPFFDISWIAVRDGDPHVIMELLGLSDPIPTTWAQGLYAVCGDFWDFAEPLNCHLSRVYVSPLVKRWRLIIGGAVGEGEENGCRQLTENCRGLSKRFGAAHGFTTQARMAWYHLVIAENGEIKRELAWGDETLADVGVPSLAEKQARQGEGQGESVVMAVAGEYSINPQELGTQTEFTGPGFLAKTALGRRQGVPRRPLDPD